MENENLGIEKLKEVLGTFLDVGVMAYTSYADDQKISTGEAIKLAFKIPSVWKAAKGIGEAIPEAKDLDPEELEELMQFVIDKLKPIKDLQK